MRTLTEPLKKGIGLDEMIKCAREKAGAVQIIGCMDSQKAHLACCLGKEASFQLIITQDEVHAQALAEDYRFYDHQALYFPARDFLFFKADIHSNLLVRERMKVYKMLLTREKGSVITTVDACMENRLMPLEKIRNSLLTYVPGDELDLSELERKLAELGYERVGQVEMPGQFSVRGGILDVYCLTEEFPWRIELWGDEIDTIRSFDIQSQRSVENLEQIQIFPADEPASGGEKVSFLDYFPEEKTHIYLDEPNHLRENAGDIQEEVSESRHNREEKGESVEDLFSVFGWEELCEELQTRTCFTFSTLEPLKNELKIREKFDLNVKSINSYNGSFELLINDLKKYKLMGYRIVLLSGSRARAQRMAKDLVQEGLIAFYGQDLEHSLLDGEIMVCYGHAHRGFEYPSLRFAVMTETDIFGQEQKRKAKKKKYNGKHIHDFAELSVGDYVIHERYGLGIYRGVEKASVDRVTKDYIKLEYRDGGVLYILATQLEVLQKYGTSDLEKKPVLNRLDSKEWQKTRKKVRKEVQNIAKELVALYASRQQLEGYAYEPDSIWQREFEEMFPYEETDDQLLAIEDVKRDMESKKIMDRLICGDVGYGKTEIAIRAAFKAVQDSRQVVYLVPTTILAQQHYNTFVERMKDYPVRIELLCRFRKPSEQKKTIEDLKKGLVDIVIGTHRLFSKDVEYKNLGLLIIDEEQRFGVKHKEKIKQMRKNIDVLTLTATPIPRTLHMSMIGIRDMSVLEEPPMDRLPIQTYVMEYDEETVREAIRRELRREGQVFYVYNRVKDIEDVTAKVASLVPEAVVEYAHGQMTEKELEDVMYRFINGEIDVLVTTTIIETGLDISRCNTMIIHDSDRYGLSQLYQLRGRIGRSNRTAYAFLMYRRNKLLGEVAEKRLAAIREFSDLGSGIRIAMKDLEIRGAGNLLGAEQHGNMNAVGYDLYCKMLAEAVREAKGEETGMEEFTTSVDLAMNAFLPPSYIPNEFQKLDVYKRIAGIENEEDYEDMVEELIDRFGELPPAAENLLKIAKLKALAHRTCITDIRQRERLIVLTVYEFVKMDLKQLPVLTAKYYDIMTIRGGSTMQFVLKPKEKVLETLEGFVNDVEQILKIRPAGKPVS